MLERTTPARARACHTRGIRKSIAALVFVHCLLHAQRGEAAIVIFSGGQPGVVHQRSDQSQLPADSGFFFEVGIFYGGFAPDAQNIDQWLANWKPLSDSSGTPLPDATVPFTSISSIFGAFDGFTGSVELDHNNSPFAIGEQGFIWGFDNRSAPGSAQWILMTNVDWTIPNGTSPLSLSQTWTVEGADETVVGEVNAASMTLESVTIGGSPTPEPTSFLLLGMGFAMCGLRRRRARSSRS